MRIRFQEASLLSRLAGRVVEKEIFIIPIPKRTLGKVIYVDQHTRETLRGLSLWVGRVAGIVAHRKGVGLAAFGWLKATATNTALV